MRHRMRFVVDDDDPRPVKWPLPAGNVYWISGLDPHGRSRLVAVLDDGVLEEFWPDAEDVDVLRMEEPRVVFSERFWEPDWFVEKGPTP